mgnify:CR=1 FL=1
MLFVKGKKVLAAIVQGLDNLDGLFVKVVHEELVLDQVILHLCLKALRDQVARLESNIQVILPVKEAGRHVIPYHFGNRLLDHLSLLSSVNS